MALVVTAAQVRNKLVTVSSVKLSDDKLESAGMIPFGVAYMNKILSNNGVDYDELGVDDTALVLGAAISVCAALTISTYPEADWENGLIRHKGVKSVDKKEIKKQLQAEFRQVLQLLDYSETNLTAEFVGGDDYLPDGENLRSVSFADTNKTYSIWT